MQLNMKKNKLTNKTTYLRSTSSYTVVSNEATHGKLSAGALGLLVIVLSNTDTFIIHKTEIENRSGFGERKFNEYWEELVCNGFIYSLKQSKGRISYHYVIVNEPNHKSNKRALKEILENHTLFSGDGEPQMKSQEPNTNSDKKDTNISLNNEDLSNEDINNIDSTNSTLAMNETPNNIEETVQFWYKNINNERLREEELLILEDTLFISTYTQLISILRSDKLQLNEIVQKMTLYQLFNFYQLIRNYCIDNSEPFTSFYLANELVKELKVTL